MDYSAVWHDAITCLLPLLHGLRDSLSGMHVSAKSDGTLVTDADLQVQEAIFRVVREHDPGACFLAEECADRLDQAEWPERLWVVDPIDGTSQFVDPLATEFCSVIVALERGVPTACLVVAPELGAGRRPVVISVVDPRRTPRVNGGTAATAAATRNVCLTRSSRREPTVLETAAVAAGLVPKVRGTSMALDMARTVLDLHPVAGLESFRWFVEPSPLLWDAAAGIMLATAMGQTALDRDGRPLEPLPAGILLDDEPRLPGAIIARTGDLDWILANGARAGV